MVEAGEYDTAVALAFLFHWDYWQVEALPVDYIEELFARVGAENDIRRGTDAAGKPMNETVLSRLRAANAAALRKLRLKPL